MLSLIFKCAVNIRDYLLTDSKLVLAPESCARSQCIFTLTVYQTSLKFQRRTIPLLFDIYNFGRYADIPGVLYLQFISVSVICTSKYVETTESEYQNGTRGYQNLVTVKYFFKYNSREYRIEFSNRWLNGTVSAITHKNMFQTSKLSLSLRINNISIFAVM